MTPIARKFFTELAEKHDVEDAAFLVEDADDRIGGLRREGCSHRVQQYGFEDSAERVIREVECRTSSYSNCFSHLDPATAETWLQAHAVWWNHAQVNPTTAGGPSPGLDWRADEARTCQSSARPASGRYSRLTRFQMPERNR